MKNYLNGRHVLLSALAISALSLGTVEMAYSWHYYGHGYRDGYRGGYHGYYRGYRGYHNYNRGWYGVGYRPVGVWVGRTGCGWIPAHRNRFGQYIPGHRAC